MQVTFKQKVPLTIFFLARWKKDVKININAVGQIFNTAMIIFAD